MTIVEQNDLIEFPCDYLFKAFCANDSQIEFYQAVKQAVNSIVPCGDDAIKQRQSSQGNYACVTAMVRLENRSQLEAINTAIRKIDTLMFML
jgi:putative lipoic acid-binding regulatory protein